MNNLLHVSSSPHVRCKDTTQNLMLDVVIAMLPAAAFGVYRFGLYSLAVILATVAACVASEYAYEKFMGKPITVSDCSAVVTGMILALNMPPEIPIWIPMLGGVFAIIVVKQLYGGLVNLTDLFLGFIPGTIGEVSTLALLIGGAYMIVKKVISPKIPLVYIGTFAVFVFLFGGFDVNYTLNQVCAGGLVFGAFFMATDYVTSPITPNGQIVYGVILGLLTGVFRLWGASPEGVSYAIILSNLFVPMIERFTLPKAFGKEGKQS